jgi:hypothetical protein
MINRDDPSVRDPVVAFVTQDGPSRPMMIREIWKFLTGVFRHWGPLLTGGVFAVSILLVEHFSGKPLSWQAISRIMLVALGVACYRTWRDEYRKRVKAESLLRKTGANLTGSIDAAYYREGAAKPGNPSKRDFDIYLKSTIVNKSPTPITIRDYVIDLSRDGYYVTGYPREDYLKWRLREVGREGDFDLDKLEKLKKIPLKQGIQKEVWTLFKVARFPFDTVTTFTLTLSITDAFGEVHVNGPAPSHPGSIRGLHSCSGCEGSR